MAHLCSKRVTRAAIAAVSLIAWIVVAAHGAGRLVSGPMLGHRAHREVSIWLETEDAQRVAIEYWNTATPNTVRALKFDTPPASPAGGQVITAKLGLLEMGASYEYRVRIDGKVASTAVPCRFSTTTQWEWRSPPPDFSFLFGSCLYVNDPPYDRPGTPYGKSTGILRHMAASGADFMLWGGDNWYYREADFSSVAGLWYRARHDRSIADLQPLLGAMHHYAIWDDHDYGSNDSNKAFEFKDPALEIFNAYWANPSAGQAGHPGIYTKFFWSDAMFILLDDRWYRDDTTLDASTAQEKRTFGRHQMDWLKQSLLQSKVLRQSTFTFIVTGGQILTDHGGRSEGMVHYKAERAELLDFIRDQKIAGVVLLTGDVHFTELGRTRVGETQWIYELTSSPFTSGSWDPLTTERVDDPVRVPGTVVGTQNYCQLALAGPRDARTLTIRCFDSANTLRWTHVVQASDLK